jgi:hypothetical protein
VAIPLGEDDQDVEEDGLEGLGEVGVRRLDRHFRALFYECKMILIGLTLATAGRLQRGRRKDRKDMTPPDP